jgi:hypothetical protein
MAGTAYVVCKIRKLESVQLCTAHWYMHSLEGQYIEAPLRELPFFRLALDLRLTHWRLLPFLDQTRLKSAGTRSVSLIAQ